MRNVIWNYDVPTFVSENKGEPIIVVNLARIIEGSTNVEAQFIEVLSTTAHECFHAAFSVLKKSLPDSIKAKNVAELLLEVVQNEGVAYYLSLQTHIDECQSFRIIRRQLWRHCRYAHGIRNRCSPWQDGTDGNINQWGHFFYFNIPANMFTGWKPAST